MLGLFKEAGFDADVITVKRWDDLPPRAQNYPGSFEIYLMKNSVSESSM